jgi:DNA invertase Pin-like site-specific DNA recombinase
MIKARKVDAVLTYHVDRLSRNLKEAGELTELMDKGLLKEVRTLSDVYVTSSDLLKMNIGSVFAENYSRELSEKVRAGNVTKLKKGEYPSAAPVGYINIHNGLILDPNKYHHIKDIFQLYASGFSIGQIVKKKYLEGFRSKGGNKMYKSSVERIKKNQSTRE